MFYPMSRRSYSFRLLVNPCQHIICRFIMNLFFLFMRFHDILFILCSVDEYFVLFVIKRRSPRNEFQILYFISDILNLFDSRHKLRQTPQHRYNVNIIILVGYLQYLIMQKQEPQQPQQNQATVNQQVQNNQQQPKQNPKQTQEIKQKAEENQISDNPIKKELMEIGFEERLIDEAQLMFQVKDEIIEYIITKLDESDPKVIEKKEEMMVEENEEDYQDIQEEYKMIFLVRMDLKMGLGKIAAQVGHAALKAYKQMEARIDYSQLDEISFFEWMETGQKKIVVKVSDQKQLLTILNKARDRNLNHCYIRDAGLTQIAAGSLTVGAIGPALTSELDSLTKHLKLL